MGEVSSDTPQDIGERLAQAMVEQCADLGGSLEDYADAVTKVASIISRRATVESGIIEQNGVGLTREEAKLIGSGRVITAMKEVRIRLGIPLVQAKKIVDQWRGGGR